MRFALADRAPAANDIERAKTLLRRALPCTSDELNRLAAEHSIGAKTLQRARRVLRVKRRELRDEHGRVSGYRWTTSP
jgi:hypothetical protein